MKCMVNQHAISESILVAVQVGKDSQLKISYSTGTENEQTHSELSVSPFFILKSCSDTQLGSGLFCKATS